MLAVKQVGHLVDWKHLPREKDSILGGMVM